MSRLSSVSISLKKTSDLSPEIAALEASYGTQLDGLDADGDGKIDRMELLMFIRDVADREKKAKYLKYAAIGLVALLVLFALTSFGTVWAVVALSEKIDTGGDGNGSGPGAALVSSDTGETLRTASGLVTLSPMQYNEPSAMAIYENATVQTRRRLLQTGNQTYLGDLAPADVLAGCEMLLEGHKDIVTTLPYKWGRNETLDMNEVVMSTSVLTASVSECRRAVADRDVEGLNALLFIDTYKSRVRVYCETSSSCQVFNVTSTVWVSGSGGNGRRLLGMDTSNGIATVTFGMHRSLVCSLEQCRFVDEYTNRFGRQLLVKCRNDYDCARGSCCIANAGQYCGECDIPPPPECFPASSLVVMEDGTSKEMRDVDIGDRILTVDASGAISASPVYVMPHSQQTGMFHFKRIATASNHTITATPGHYMIISDRQYLGDWDRRHTLVASRIEVGDHLWVLAEEEPKLKLTTVTGVSDVYEEGLFAPFTLTGTIVSDNVVASVYVDLFGSSSAMHAFCGWVRALWVAWPGVFKGLHSVGWLSAVAMGVAYAAKMALYATCGLAGMYS